MISVLESLTAKGDGAVNEDLFGRSDRCAWLLDGATGVTAPRLDPNSDAAWFVRRMNNFLSSLEAAKTEQTMPALIKRAVMQISAEFEDGVQDHSQPPSPPSAACVFARRRGEQIEILSLGDCAALVETPAGVVEFVDGDTDPPLDADSIDQLISFQESFPEAPHKDIIARLAPALRRKRSTMNTPAGYWILSTDQNAVDHAHIKTYQPTNAPVILMSDGFSRAMDMLGGLSARQFYDLILSEGPRTVLDELRAAERADANCRRFPRFKVHDDATCAVLRFG